MRDRSAPLSAGGNASLAWKKMNGLLPAIVQDRGTGRVLMLGYMNEESLEATLNSGLATFFSRSKQRLWQKGETSGHHLHVHSVFADCDEDTLLLLVDPNGPACHTGALSCFGNATTAGPAWLGELSAIVEERQRAGDPSSYTRRLLEEGRGRIAQKVGEEGLEVALAAVSRSADECAEELADLLFHVVVLMQSLGLSWDQIMAVLRARHSAASNSTAAS